MKKFIRVNEENIVEFIHYMPFDKEYGLNKTEGELLEIGYLIDEIPEPEMLEGQRVVYRYNVETNTLSYILEDVPMPMTMDNKLLELERRIELLVEENKELKNQIETLKA